MSTLKKKLIGDRKFYGMALRVAIPIILQNGITNVVNMLDNIMVGRVGTEPMSGVAIVNQLMFVFNICIFGAISGAGIFTAQFWGCDKQEGVRHTFRFKWLISLLIGIIGVLLFVFRGEDLALLYLHGEENQVELLMTLDYAKQYIFVIIFSMIPFAIEQVYTSTLRECGETVLPMKAGMVAVFVNLVLNYLLIFGHFGFPKLGVVGAATATVIARWIEAIIVIVWTHVHKEKNPYIVGIYKSFYIPANLVKKILVKGTPLMLNECFWSLGMASLTQCYSYRGLDAVAALNICTTIGNVFNVVYISMGSAVAIIVGQLLGAGKMEEAKDTDTKLIAFSVMLCLGIGTALGLTAPLFPQVYNTSNEVRSLATDLIRILALVMPMHAFLHSAYFTLRSGGKTMITFLFDSVFMWVASIPLAFVLSRYTSIPMAPMYFVIQAIEIVKCIIGFVLLKKGVWLQNIVVEE